MSIGRKTAHGVLWTLLEKFSQQLMMLVIFLIVARLLGPREFGLVSIGLVFTVFAQMLALGVVDGVISQRIEDDRRLSTIFWVLVLLGTALTATTYLLADSVSTVIGEPRLSELLRWLSPVAFLSALASVPTAIIQARMDFRILTLRSFVATAISGIVGIGMAMEGYGAYSMIAQQLVQQAVINFIIWPGSGWWPRRQFESRSLGEMLAPGIRMSGSLIVDLLESQLPRLLIGVVLGPVAVGYYAFVGRVWQALREIIVLPLVTVLFPALVQVRHDPTETKKFIDTVIYLTGFLLLPAIAVIAATAHVFVPLFFGPDWMPSVPVMQWFLISVMFGPFLLIFRNILRARGAMGVYLKLQLSFAFINIGVMMWLSQQGLPIMLGGLFVAALAFFPVQLQVASRASGVVLWHSMNKLWAVFLASALVFVGLVSADSHGWFPAEGRWHLLVALSLGGMSYLMLCFVLQYREMSLLFGQLHRLISRRA